MMDITIYLFNIHLFIYLLYYYLCPSVSMRVQSCPACPACPHLFCNFFTFLHIFFVIFYSLKLLYISKMKYIFIIFALIFGIFTFLFFYFSGFTFFSFFLYLLANISGTGFLLFLSYSLGKKLASKTADIIDKRIDFYRDNFTNFEK